MGCCILGALLISQGIVLFDRAREQFWLLVCAALSAAGAVTLLALHWTHVGEMWANPMAFQFPSQFITDAANICRTLLP
jgi:hypothetical protein